MLHEDLAGQFVFAGFIKLKLPIFWVMLITRLLAIGPAVVIALLAANNPGVSAQMNEWLNTLQSIQLPFALLPVMVFTGKKRIMGRFQSPLRWRIGCWVMAIALVAINTYFVIDFLTAGDSPLPHGQWFTIVVIIYAFYYYGLIIWMVKDDAADFWQWVKDNKA